LTHGPTGETDGAKARRLEIKSLGFLQSSLERHLSPPSPRTSTTTPNKHRHNGTSSSEMLPLLQEQGRSITTVAHMSEMKWKRGGHNARE